MPARSPVRDFVDQQEMAGKYWFQRDEIASLAEPGSASVRVTLHRLQGEGRVQRVWRDFYVVVPLKFKSEGCPPTTWFFDPLMKAMGQVYYVGLLSAVEIQAHRSDRSRARSSDWDARSLQVFTDVRLAPIRIKGGEIQFFQDSRMKDAPVEVRAGPTTSIRVSTPALTALNLIEHAAHCGGMDAVLEHLAELGVSIQGEDLERLAYQRGTHSRPDLLRLGYWLDQIRASALADALWNALFGEAKGSDKRIRRNESLSEAIRRVPEEVFWKNVSGSGKVPDYNRIFTWYLREIYGSDLPSSTDLLDRLERGKILNLSTFQRVVASERKRREPSIRLYPDGSDDILDDQNRWSLLVNVPPPLLRQR